MNCERCEGTGRTKRGIPKEDIIKDETWSDGKVVCPSCAGEGEL